MPSHGVKLRSHILGVVIQIGLIDIVFSLDSVFTAVGLAQHVEIMVAAIVVAVLRHDVRGAADQRVHRPPPDDQDAGAVRS